MMQNSFDRSNHLVISHHLNLNRALKLMEFINLINLDVFQINLNQPIKSTNYHYGVIMQFIHVKYTNKHHI